MLTNLIDLKLTCSTVEVQPENMCNKMQLLMDTILGRLSSLKSLTLVPRASSYANSIDDAGTTGMTISGGFSSLFSAPALLQRLDISPLICKLSYPPKWIGQLHNLCILKFGVIKVDRDDVNVLRGLPALTVLSLYVQTKPAETVVIGKTGFPVTKYFKFKCCGPWLKFEEGAMPNLHKLKLVFNACNADEEIIRPVGIRYLSNLKEVSAKIGGASTDKSHRKACVSELSLRDEIRVHGSCQRVNIQCVKQIIVGEDDQSYITTPEDHVSLKQKQNKIKDEDEENSIIEHVEITKDHSRAHQFNLPETSSEMAAINKFLHFHGAPKHPRSIAEQERRTKISQRIKKLQELVPNIDKQNNTSDMLDSVVDYIKDLQNQFKALNESHDRCSCSARKHE